MIQNRFRTAAILVLALNPALGAEWRRLGNSALDLHLSGVATGPMDQVRFTADGRLLFARTSTGQWLETEDFETWRVSAEPDSAPNRNPAAYRLPEAQVTLRAGSRGALYAFGRQVWRSDDQGRSWRDLTGWKLGSLLGAAVMDLAISPVDEDFFAAATGSGMWRSMDGGATWSSMNEALPHLPVRKLLSTPDSPAGLAITLLAPPGLKPAVFSWKPGERSAWRPISGALSVRQQVIDALSKRFGVPISAVAGSGDWVYAGSVDGRLFVSLDGGNSWLPPAFNPGGSVESIVIDPSDPHRALASLSRRGDAAQRSPLVLRTLNGGLIWDDLTANLPEGAAFGITADFPHGAVYAATPGGIYRTRADLAAMGPATPWTRVASNFPAAPVMDVRLDGSGRRLYAAVYGFGVYETAAPHREGEIAVVSATDWNTRPAAPGALLTVLGRRMDRVNTPFGAAPILAASPHETQIQLPYNLTGSSITLSMESPEGLLTVPLPLDATAPSIFVDRDGGPMILDAGTGLILDANSPASGGSVIQILAAGLGRVEPDWPAGLAAPLDRAMLPTVIAPVNVWLNGAKLPVLRATLAPGYTGFYLVEVELPRIVNSGDAELYLETANSTSNRVRLFIE